MSCLCYCSGPYDHYIRLMGLKKKKIFQNAFKTSEFSCINAKYIVLIDSFKKDSLQDPSTNEK